MTHISNMLHCALRGEISDVYSGIASQTSTAGVYIDIKESGLTIPLNNYVGSEYGVFDRDHTAYTEITYDKLMKISELQVIKECTPSMLKDIIDGVVTDELQAYGLMIEFPDGGRLNPLHPIMAYYIASGDIVLPEKFALTFYPVIGGYHQDKAEVDEFIEKIAALFPIIANPIAVTSSVKPRKPLNDLLSGLDYGSLFDAPAKSVITCSASGSIADAALTPVQFSVVRGLVAPYYGLVSSEYDSDENLYFSINLFPMFSHNISAQSSSDRDTTCLGDLSHTSVTNLHVLSMSNGGSAYTDHIIPERTEITYNFILACQQISAGLITKVLK